MSAVEELLETLTGEGAPGDLEIGPTKLRVWLEEPEHAPESVVTHRVPGGLHYYDVSVDPGEMRLLEQPEDFLDIELVGPDAPPHPAGLMASKADGEWIPYEGPRGGEGWKNTESGDVVYQDEPPGVTVGDDPEDNPLSEEDRVLLRYDGEIHYGEVVATSMNGESVRVRDDRNTWSLDPDDGSQYGGDMEIVNLGKGESDVEDPSTMEIDSVGSMSYVLDELEIEDAARRMTDALSSGTLDMDEAIEAVKDSGHSFTIVGKRMLGTSGGEAFGLDASPDASDYGAFTDEWRDEFEDRHGEEQREALDEMAIGWEQAMYADPRAAGMVQAAMEATGNETMPEYENSDLAAESEVSDERLEAAKNMSDFTTEALREAFGDTITVFRGFSGNPHGGTRSEGTDVPSKMREAKENGEAVEIEHRPIESWTMEPSTAKLYAGSSGAIAKTEVPVEDVFASSSAGTVDVIEEDTVIQHEGPQVYDPEDLYAGDELSDDETMFRLRAEAAMGASKNDD